MWDTRDHRRRSPARPLARFRPGDTPASFTRASSAVQAGSNGVLATVAANVLRDSHYAGGERTVLLEGQRTNLCLHSEAFDNAAWTKENTTITVNAVAAPDGTSTADTIADNATAAQHRFYEGVAETSGVTVTFSVYLKQGTHRYAQVVLNNGDGAYANVDLQAGTITHSAFSGVNGTLVAARIRDAGSGWHRVELVGTLTATQYFCIAGPVTSGTAPYGEAYAGTGTTIHAWGAQYERAPTASSYIPTTTATASRAVDNLSLTHPAGARYIRSRDPNTAAATDSITEQAGGTYAVPAGAAYTHIDVYPAGTTLTQARAKAGVA